VYLSNNLVHLRSSSGFSPKKLEAISDVKQQTINSIEKNKLVHPNLLTLIKLADTFNITLNELVYSNLSVSSDDPSTEIDKLTRELNLTKLTNSILSNRLNSIRNLLQ